MTFVDQVECYGEIAKLLRGSVQEPWSDILLKVELDEESINLESTYSTGPQSTKRKEFLADHRLAECFYELARLVSTEEKGLFKNCTFTLRSDGKYSTEFVY